jgi:hypothetical protein
VGPVHRLQQLRLQFRAVFFQIQNVRGERHLIVAVRQHNRFATARLGDEFAELALGFPNGNRFHVGALIIGTKTRKRLPKLNREPC